MSIFGDRPNSPDMDDLNRMFQMLGKFQQKQSNWSRKAINKNYDRGMGTMKGTSGLFKNFMQGSMGDLRSGQKSALGQLNKTAQGSLADLQHAQDQAQGQTMSMLAGSGLGNTTVAPSLLASQGADFGRARANVMGDVAGQKAGVYQNFAPMMAQTRYNWGNTIGDQQNRVGAMQMAAPTIPPSKFNMPAYLFPETGQSRSVGLGDIMSRFAQEGFFTGGESDGSGMWSQDGNWMTDIFGGGSQGIGSMMGLFGALLGLI